MTGKKAKHTSKPSPLDPNPYPASNYTRSQSLPFCPIPCDPSRDFSQLGRYCGDIHAYNPGFLLFSVTILGYFCISLQDATYATTYRTLMLLFGSGFLSLVCAHPHLGLADSLLPVSVIEIEELDGGDTNELVVLAATMLT